MRGRCLVAVCAAVLLAASGALAEPAETSARAARQLGNEGIELYERGDYAGALDRLQRAYRVVKVPTLGLWSARASQT